MVKFPYGVVKTVKFLAVINACVLIAAACVDFQSELGQIIITFYLVGLALLSLYAELKGGESLYAYFGFFQSLIGRGIFYILLGGLGFTYHQGFATYAGFMSLVVGVLHLVAKASKQYTAEDEPILGAG